MEKTNKTILTDVKFSLDRDKKTGNITGCYASLTYTIEDDHYVDELRIPKVEIPIPINDEFGIDCEYLDNDNPFACSKYKCYLRGMVNGTPSRFEMLEEDEIFYTKKHIKEKRDQSEGLFFCKQM